MWWLYAVKDERRVEKKQKKNKEGEMVTSVIVKVTVFCFKFSGDLNMKCECLSVPKANAFLRIILARVFNEQLSTTCWRIAVLCLKFNVNKYFFLKRLLFLQPWSISDKGREHQNFKQFFQSLDVRTMKLKLNN